MFTTLLSSTLFFALAVTGALAEFSVATIDLTQCGSAHITWEKTSGPYNVAVVPVDNPCNEILVDLGDHDGTSMTWNNVNLPSGTKVMFSLLDGTDDEAWSGVMTVKDSTDGSCLPNAKNATSSSVPTTSASATSTDAAGTTLVISNTISSVPGSTSGAIAPVGAANAGLLPGSSGALSNMRVPASVTVLGALAAVAALAL